MNYEFVLGVKDSRLKPGREARLKAGLSILPNGLTHRLKAGGKKEPAASRLNFNLFQKPVRLNSTLAKTVKRPVFTTFFSALERALPCPRLQAVGSVEPSPFSSALQRGFPTGFSSAWLTHSLKISSLRLCGFAVIRDAREEGDEQSHV